MCQRANFNDTQKAQIYIRDRATCAFSGRNLWLLDHGADPWYHIDWVDHVLPASRGGAATLENGVCVSWYLNWLKRASNAAHACLFRDGKPTADFFYIHGTLSEKLANQLRRFVTLVPSDWYLNRALWRLSLGVEWLLDNGKVGGGTRTRDDQYYAKAALKALLAWRKQSEIEGSASVETRGLAPTHPADDQAILLDTRFADSERKLRKLMKELLPYYAANTSAWNVFNGTYRQGECSASQVRTVVIQNPLVGKHIKQAIKESLTNLKGIGLYCPPV